MRIIPLGQNLFSRSVRGSVPLTEAEAEEAEIILLVMLVMRVLYNAYYEYACVYGIDGI